MSATCPPSFEQIALADGMTSWAATVQGLSDWWAAALRFGATPPELIADWIRWWGAATDRRRPGWTSRNEVVLESPVARLRDFSTARQGRVRPTLVLPPQAGHDSCIVDYSPQQSQMRTILAAGLQRAYALDWIGATAITNDATIEDYVDVIERAVDHIGDRVNLIGDCQGGWLATIFAALHPEMVNTLTIAGAPIDFHAGEPVIHAALRSLAPGGNLAFYRGLVAAGGGVLGGEHMRLDSSRSSPITRLPASCSCSATSMISPTWSAIANSRTGSSTPRRSPVRFTSGSSSTCFATTS